jgi:hypothetical protein
MAGHQDRMHVIKCLRGDTPAPYSPECNPGDFFLWGYMKEKVYQHLTGNMAALKRKVRGWVWQDPLSDAAEVHQEQEEEGGSHGWSVPPQAFQQ